MAHDAAATPVLERQDSFEQMVEACTGHRPAAKQPFLYFGNIDRFRPKAAHAICVDPKILRAGPALFYVTDRHLGRGTTSLVHLGIAVGSGHLVALKFSTLESAVYATAGALARCQSALAPNAVLQTDQQIMEVEPLLAADLESPDSMVGLSPEVRSGLAWLAARDILPALIQLHEERLAHRDIKPANIMQGSTGLHLIDHNLLVRTASSQYATTPIYAPPETFDRKHRRAGVDKLDAWCLGATLLQVAGGEKALDLLRCRPIKVKSCERWRTTYTAVHSQMLEAASCEAAPWRLLRGDWWQNRVYDAFASVSPGLRRLILELMHPNPSQRLTMAACLQRLADPTMMPGCDLEGARAFLRGRARCCVAALAPAVDEAVAALRDNTQIIKEALGALPTWLHPGASP